MFPADQGEGKRVRFVWAGISFKLVLSPHSHPLAHVGRDYRCPAQGELQRSLRGADKQGRMNRPFQPSSRCAANLYLQSQGRKSRAQLKAFLSSILWYSISHIGRLILQPIPPPPTPQKKKSLLRLSRLINFKIKTDVAGRMIYSLPPVLQFLHNARVWVFFFFNFIVHLVLFNPFLLKKFGQEQRWAQYPELETPAREEWSTTAVWWKLQETRTGGCSSQMWERRGENNIWKGKRKEKTNFLPSPSGKSIKEKKNAVSLYWSISRKWVELGQVEMRAINVIVEK